jgi:hypothetical protein
VLGVFGVFWNLQLDDIIKMTMYKVFVITSIRIYLSR